MKKVFISILILFTFLLSLNAEEVINTDNILESYQIKIGQNDEGYERTISNNYGVNKKWKITNSNLSKVMVTPYVDSSKKIYDYADILTDEEEIELKGLIDEFITKTNMDMVILSVDMPYVNDSTNEDYAADFYDYNDFGINFDNYSGVILIRNNYNEDRYYNIYTFGNAQLYFDYNRCENTLDHIYSNFVKKEYLVGMKTFINDFNNYYDDGVFDDGYYIDPDTGEMKQAFKIPYNAGMIVGGITSFIVTLVLRNKNNMVRKVENANDYLDKSSVKYMNKSDKLISSVTTHSIIPRDSGGSSSSGSGGGYSHMGSSGGFHGGGGGRHG